MSVYDYTVHGRKGEEVNLSTYKGKVLLIVNTATQCGFTPEYTELEKLSIVPDLFRTTAPHRLVLPSNSEEWASFSAHSQPFSSSVSGIQTQLLAVPLKTYEFPLFSPWKWRLLVAIQPLSWYSGGTKVFVPPLATPTGSRTWQDSSGSRPSRERPMRS